MVRKLFILSILFAIGTMCVATVYGIMHPPKIIQSAYEDSGTDWGVWMF